MKKYPLIKKQTGFTLIELVMVIVILGILAAVSLPKFVDVAGDSEFAVVRELAGSLGTAGQQNLSLKAINNPAAISIVTNGTGCSIATANKLLNKPLPVGYYTQSSYDTCESIYAKEAICVLRSPLGPGDAYHIPCTRDYP